MVARQVSEDGQCPCLILRSSKRTQIALTMLVVPSSMLK